MGDKDKLINISFFILFLVFCAFFAVQKISSFDVWWHLKTGEWIWQHKAIPYVDPFSYTFRGAEWIDFEWLFQAVIYPIYQFAGFEGLIIFKLVIILLIFMVLFFTCREFDKGKAWLSITLLLVALLVARDRFTVRPDIFFIFFLALYGYFLTLYKNEKITSRQLIIFLLPIHVLWVNFHGSFLIGIFLVGAFAMGSFIPLALSHRRDLKPVFADKKLRSLLLLCLLLCLVSLLNPHTYRAFLIPLQTTGAEETLKGIAEWQSVPIKFLGVFTLDPTMWFRALFLVGVASFFMNSRNNFMKVENILIFLLFSYMAFKHIRFSGAFAIATVPIIIYNLSQFRRPVSRWRWVFILPILTVIIFSVNVVITLLREERLGFGFLKHYPQTTVSFLKKHHVSGKIFNSYGYGGYIIWHCWPDIPVFIDGRTVALYDQDFFWLYSFTELKKELWEKVSERYGIEIVLVNDDRDWGYTSLAYWLDEDENWQLVAFDDVAILYMRKSKKFDQLIEQYSFHYLRPSDFSMDYAKVKKDDKKYLGALERELKEACQRFPQDFYPFYYLGIYHSIYGTQDHFLKAEEAFIKAIANRKDFPQGHYELGLTYMQLERYDEAIKELKKAIGLNPNILADAYYNLGLSLFQKGKIREAIKFLEIYKEKAAFGTRVEAYRLLGKAYLQRYKLQKALSCFERVGYLEEPGWETFLNMGVAYLGLDRLEEARESFERAMEMRPDQVKPVYNLAVVYEKLGLKEKAKSLYEKASQLKPQTAEDEIWLQKAKEKTK
jgi:tetratricopeptide (TPR) repeat protein